MVRSGDLCKGCGRQCGHDFEKVAIQIECPICDGLGKRGTEPCTHCRSGFIAIRQCPREFMGSRFMRAVNMAAICGKGDWPVSGGLMDQSAWFISLYQSLKAEENRIEAERLKNGSRH